MAQTIDDINADLMSDIIERLSSGERNAIGQYLTPRQWAAKIREVLQDPSTPAEIKSSQLLSQIGWAMKKIMTAPDFKPGPAHDPTLVAQQSAPTPEQIARMNNSQKIESLIATSTPSFRGGGGQVNV